MEDFKINLIKSEEQPLTKPKSKKKPIIVAGVILFLVYFSLSPLIVAKNLTGFSPSRIWTQLKNLGFNRDKLLKGEERDRINLLFLGMGGEGHDGAYLTDTIILASVKPSNSQVALLSVPRDLLVPIPGYGWRRVNNANAFGEVNQEENGAAFTAEVVSRAFSLPIDYFIRVDFNGFKQFIDDLGGVRINVEKPFTDSLYPTEDYKYQTISFQEGWQTMDGEEALKFTRSRHGSNGEGSDFARSRRQQKVLLAAKEKLFSFGTFLRPDRVQRIMNDLENHLVSNLETWEALRLGKIFNNSNEQNISLNILDDGPEGLLEEKIIDGAFFLQPKNNDWQKLRNFISNVLPNGKKEQKTNFSNIIIEIQNGTFLPGLAASTSEQLKQLGFTVASVGNAPKRDFNKTIIYNLAQNQNTAALETLQKELGAQIIQGAPEWLAAAADNNNSLLNSPEVKVINQKVDFLVVLGTDAASF